MDSRTGKKPDSSSFTVPDSDWISTGNDDGEVQIAFTVSYVLMRVKGDPRSMLVFTLSEWDAFRNGVRNGEFDDIAEG